MCSTNLCPRRLRVSRKRSRFKSEITLVVVLLFPAQSMSISQCLSHATGWRAWCKYMSLELACSSKAHYPTMASHFPFRRNSEIHQRRCIDSQTSRPVSFKSLIIISLILIQSAALNLASNDCCIFDYGCWVLITAGFLGLGKSPKIVLSLSAIGLTRLPQGEVVAATVPGMKQSGSSIYIINSA